MHLEFTIEGFKVHRWQKTFIFFITKHYTCTAECVNVTATRNQDHWMGLECLHFCFLIMCASILWQLIWKFAFFYS